MVWDIIQSNPRGYVRDGDICVRGWLNGEISVLAEISARQLRYGKEKNDLNKKHEVWKSAKLSQTCSIKQTYLDGYFK